MQAKVNCRSNLRLNQCTHGQRADTRPESMAEAQVTKNDAARKEEGKRPTLTKVKAIGHAEQSAGAIARDGGKRSSPPPPRLTPRLLLPSAHAGSLWILVIVPAILVVAGAHRPFSSAPILSDPGTCFMRRGVNSVNVVSWKRHPAAAEGEAIISPSARNSIRPPTKKRADDA